jgi:uncharacterized protein (TIGR03437 family)
LKLDAAFSAARFLTYLGGGCNDSASRIALDPSGNIWLSGTTNSPDFPVKEPFQSSGLIGSRTPGFVTEFNSDGSQLLFSSFSEAAALTLGPDSVYLAGSSGGSAIVTKIDLTKRPALAIDSVEAVLAFPAGTIGPVPSLIAPGQWVRIRGRNLGPAAKVSAQLDATRHLPFMLGNTVVFFDSVPAPLLSVEGSTIECFVPFGISTALFRSKVTVLAAGQVSEPVTVGVTVTAPQVLSILNSDGTVNSAEQPARPGSEIAIFVSGLGQTDPAGADGLVNAAPLPVPLTPVRVFFPGSQFSVEATPSFVGGAPGLMAGITQVNVTIPASISNAVNPITFSVNVASARLYLR